MAYSSECLLKAIFPSLIVVQYLSKVVGDQNYEQNWKSVCVCSFTWARTCACLDVSFNPTSIPLKNSTPDINTPLIQHWIFIIKWNLQVKYLKDLMKTCIRDGYWVCHGAIGKILWKHLSEHREYLMSISFKILVRFTITLQDTNCWIQSTNFPSVALERSKTLCF